MSRGADDAKARGLDRLLPALVWDTPELRHRARALVRVSLWVAGWASVIAALLYRDGRPYWAALVAVSALGAASAIPRLVRTADPPASASWLGWNVLIVAFFAALASGGPTSPVLFGAAVAAATSAAFGSAHGVAMALLVPVGLFAARFMGVVLPPLEGVLADGATLGTLALVAGATAEFLVAERSARDAVKARALRQGALSTDTLRREAEELRGLVDNSPFGLFSVERDGRIGRVRSGTLDSVLGETAPGTELLALLARGGDAQVLRRAREGLTTWSRTDDPTAVLASLPARLRWGEGWLDLRYAPVAGAEGGLERVVVGVGFGAAQDRLPPGTVPINDLLARCAERAESAGLEVRLDAELLPVPVAVLTAVESAVDALIDNVVVHGEPPEVRRQNGKAEQAVLELRAERRGRRIVLSVADDGAGFDWRRITEGAHQRGWAASGKRELEDVVTTLGFSTATGRPGQGLARARSAAESLGGALSLSSSLSGEGAVVEMVLPSPIPPHMRARGRPLSGRRTDPTDRHAERGRG